MCRAHCQCMRMRCEQFMPVLKLGCSKRSVLGDGCARCEACLRCLHDGQNPRRPGTGPSSSCCCWRWPPSHQAFSSVCSPLLAASQRTIGCFRRRSPLTSPPSLLFLRMMSPHRQKSTQVSDDNGRPVYQRPGALQVPTILRPTTTTTTTRRRRRGKSSPQRGGR